jgi:hypothetical protein
MFGKNLVPAEATIVDKHVLRTVADSATKNFLPVHQYAADVQLEGETAFRTKIDEKLGKIAPPSIGDVVPVLVDPKTHEVKFDEKDPRLNLDAYLKRTKAQDQNEFEATLRQDPGTPAEAPEASPGGNEQLLEAMEKMRGFREGVDGSARPASPGDDEVEKLTKLAALHAAGGLTDEEFQTMKAKLIG